MSLTETKSKIQKLKDELSEQSGLLFAEAIKEFFDKNPRVQTIKWQQYVPYFNDGEACEFAVYDPSFAFTEKVDEYEAGEFIESWSLPAGLPEEDAIGELSSTLQEISLFLQYKFGEHAEVTIERDGETTVEEYSDHD